MDSDIEQVRSLLLKLQSNEVNQAEKQLETISDNPKFRQIILYIIRRAQQDDWTRTIAASYLNQLYSHITVDTQQKAYNQLVEVLMDVQIRQIDKRCFQKSLISAIEASTQQFQILWQQRLFDCLQNKEHYDTAYLILASIAVADIPDQILRVTIQKVFEPVLSSLEVCVQNANLLNQMMKMWIVILDKLKQDEENKQIIFFMANSPKLLNIIDIIYQLKASEAVMVCQISELYELNLLKYQAAEVNKRLINFAVQDQDRTYSTLLQYAKKNLPLIARTLFLMATKKQEMQKSGCDDLTTSLISIYQQYVLLKSQEFQLLEVIRFQNIILYPFIQVNDDEKERFEESPEEFNSLTEDCCDKQTYGILKTEAIKLLETFGDKIQGSIQYSINRAIDSLKIKLGFVQAFEGSDLVPLEIESAFLILSIFSYKIGTYPSELTTLKAILNDERTKSLPPLELSRVFTFLAYNYNEIYPVPAEGENWINMAVNSRVHPTTNYCAFDFLSNLVEDYFNQIFLQTITDEICKGKMPLVWEVTTKIIQNHHQQLSAQGIVSLISKLYFRIDKELQQLHDKDKTDTLDLINCLRMFINLLENMKQQNRDSIDIQTKAAIAIPHFWKVLDYYNTVLQYDIEDEIVKISIQLIQYLPIIASQIYPFVKKYSITFKANGYFQKFYIRFFNEFLMKADFNRDLTFLMDAIITMKDAFLHNLMIILDKGNDTKMSGTPTQRVTLGNILIIIQNILAMFGNNMILSNSTEFFYEISSLCVRILPINIAEIQKTSSGRILMSRALNILLLCHMHVPMESIYTYLTQFQQENLYHGYDTQVLVACICKQILKEKDFTAIKTLLTSMMTIVSKAEEKDQILEKKKKKKNKIKAASQIKKIGEFDKLLKQINTPFQAVGTVKDIITNLLNTMKFNNFQIFRTIVDNLSPQIVKIVKEYVNIETTETKPRVIRKVVGVKISMDEGQIQREPARRTINNRDIEENSDVQGEISLKRQRVKIKAQNKDKKSKISKVSLTRKMRE